jgi:hypothetical protein
MKKSDYKAVLKACDPASTLPKLYDKLRKLSIDTTDTRLKELLGPPVQALQQAATAIKQGKKVHGVVPFTSPEFAPLLSYCRSKLEEA